MLKATRAQGLSDGEMEGVRARAAGKETATGGSGGVSSSGSGSVRLRRSGGGGGDSGAAMGAWSMDGGLLAAMGFAESPGSGHVQRKGDGEGGDDGRAVAIGEAGVRGLGGALPHGEAIQRSFGRHDIRGIQAHTGGEAATAARTLGAEAYATGNHVAFAGEASLHTAAHEAAHVVQQRAGVQLKGGLGAAGDAHEQHADAVADAVVAGRSAEALLDQYGGGGGGGSVVQRQVPPEGATSGAKETNGATGTTGTAGETSGDANAHAPAPAAAADVKAVIQRLGSVQLPTFAGIADGAFSVDAVATWIGELNAALIEAKAAAAASAGAAPAELAQAVEQVLAANAPMLQQVAAEILAANAQLISDSSVAKLDPAKAIFPSTDEVRRLAAATRGLDELRRDGTLPAGAASRASLQPATAAMQDAALAVMQSLSVERARARWKTGAATETPSVADAGKGERTVLDDIYDESDFSDRVSKGKDKKDGSEFVFDWCGFFVASAYYTGPGLAHQLRSGFYHVDNIKDFFFYSQTYNAGRAPAAIWAENQWWNLKEFHAERGSPRKWTKRSEIRTAMAGGGAVDIRPGDVCLIDHDGADAPSHIVMVESYDAATGKLVTIEGNTYGIHADATGKAERVDDEHLKASERGNGTAAGLQVRDLGTLNPKEPEPGTYEVTNPKTYVRQDDDLTKFKKEGGKMVRIPEKTTVEVTEITKVGSARYGHVKDWGWTPLSNLTAGGKPPPGAYAARKGSTVWGVGRPSIVDFEDGHEFAIKPVPEVLRTKSPAEIRELAAVKRAKNPEEKAATTVTIK